MSNSKSDLVDLTLIYLGSSASGLAVFVKLDEKSPKVSLPLSAIEIERNAPKVGQCKVTMHQPFAEEKGLV